MAYESVGKGDLREVFPLIRDSIDGILHREGNGVIPEEVYIDLLNEDAFLFMNELGDFFVVEEMPKEKRLNVWLGYVQQDGRTANEKDGVEKMLLEVMHLVRETGYERLTFVTNRKGWVRRLRRTGVAFNTYPSYMLEVPVNEKS